MHHFIGKLRHPPPFRQHPGLFTISIFSGSDSHSKVVFITFPSSLGLTLDTCYPGPRGFSWFFLFSQSAEYESQSGEKENPLVTLDLNLTFMQIPAVKRIKLIIRNGTNGSLACMLLSATNVSTRVEKSGSFWPGSMCVFVRVNSSSMIVEVLSC